MQAVRAQGRLRDVAVLRAPCPQRMRSRSQGLLLYLWHHTGRLEHTTVQTWGAATLPRMRLSMHAWFLSRPPARSPRLRKGLSALLAASPPADCGHDSELQCNDRVHHRRPYQPQRTRAGAESCDGKAPKELACRRAPDTICTWAPGACSTGFRAWPSTAARVRTLATGQRAPVAPRKAGSDASRRCG